jgi:hypothetical protein
VFLDEEECCDGAGSDCLLFVRRGRAEPSRDRLGGVGFFGACGARGESRKGRTFAGTVVRFGLGAGVEGMDLLV